jgi:hypothetical protein
LKCPLDWGSALGFGYENVGEEIQELGFVP